MMSGLTENSTHVSGWRLSSSATLSKYLQRAFFSLALYCVSAAAAAAADQSQNEWTGQLIEAASGADYGPLEELSIKIPEHVTFETLSNLGLELDAIDVTPLLDFNDHRFSYRPPQALEPGTHQLRLVEIAPDGSLIERGNWRIVVSAAAAVIGSESHDSRFSVAASNSAEFSQRLADKGFEDTPARGQVSGGGNAEFAFSSGHWSVAGNANYLAETQKDRSISGRGFDLGEYSFNTRIGGGRFVGELDLGHQSLEKDSFVVSNYSRRGISASLGTQGDELSFTGFSFLPESIVGSDNITGLGDSDNRLMGLQAIAHPVPALGKDLSITGTYYSGRGSNGGFGIGGGDSTDKGTGWSFVAESLLFDGSVSVVGQFARSRFEQGDAAFDDDRTSSHARSLALSYTPFQAEEVAGSALSLTVGASYDRIDSFFRSLANPSLAADRESILLYSDLYWGSFSANLQGLHQTNNVDDLVGLPTDGLRSLQFSGSYYPTIEPPAEGDTDWFGQPYLTLNVGTVDNRRVKTPQGYLGADTDNSHFTMTVGGGTAYSNWGWQVAETFTRFLDRTDISSDSKSYLTDFSANWQVNDALQLNGSMQWILFSDKGSDNRTHNLNFNLGIQAEIIRDTLRATLNSNLNLLTGDGDTPDNAVANGEIEWTLLSPTENHVGVALAFQGLVENKDGNGDTSIDGTDWQIYSLLRISAPISY